MSEFASSQNIKVAAPNRRIPFNLSHKTITTQDISVLTPVSVKEIVPGDEFNVKVSSFVRLAPMPCPTYGDMILINRAFFVPYRTIWPNWREFIDNAPFTTLAGITSRPVIPRVTATAIYSAFIENDFLTTELTQAQVEAGDVYDFDDSPGTQVRKFKLTYQGKRLYSLLLSLGYQVFKAASAYQYSLLPLLAYAKIYYDWYLPDPFTSNYFFLRYFNNTGTWNITSGSDFANFLDNLPIFEPLEKDYFTAAFLEPFGNKSAQNSFMLQSINFGKDTDYGNNRILSYQEYYGNISPTSLVPHADGVPDIKTLTQYGLDALKAVDSFVKRNQLAGNKYQVQSLARYGVHVSDIEANRSEYLGNTSQRISIGEVMSTADTSGLDEVSNLGDYAGRGVGSNFGSFRVDSNEFGLFICLSCVQVSTGYPYGVKRELVMHLEREDFFTPEYDQLGNQPISKQELRANKVIDGSQSYGTADSIFGWTPRYSEYKTSMDNLHGDFCIAQFASGMDSWHLFRSLDGNLVNAHPNMGFINGDPMNINNDFGRIFSVNQGQDHFIAVHDVNIKAYRKMHSLSDSLLTEGEGGEVSVGYNGSNF